MHMRCTLKLLTYYNSSAEQDAIASTGAPQPNL